MLALHFLRSILVIITHIAIALFTVIILLHSFTAFQSGQSALFISIESFWHFLLFSQILMRTETLAIEVETIADLSFLLSLNSFFKTRRCIFIFGSRFLGRVEILGGMISLGLWRVCVFGCRWRGNFFSWVRKAFVADVFFNAPLEALNILFVHFYLHCLFIITNKLLFSVRNRWHKCSRSHHPAFSWLVVERGLELQNELLQISGLRRKNTGILWIANVGTRNKS